VAAPAWWTAELEAAARRFRESPRHGRVPRRTGRAFAEALAQDRPPPGHLALWYLGQASVVWRVGLEGGRTTTAWIDPYLAPNPGRRYPPLLAPEEVPEADLVLITHEHEDHLDPFTVAGLARACPGAVFVAPPVCRPRLREAGVPEDRILTPRTGEATRVGAWEVTAVPNAHEEVDYDPDRGHRWTGYVAGAGGLWCYHAGDGVAADPLLAALEPWIGRLDVALLPINGRDYFRLHEGCLGNFTFREAAEIAMRLDAGVTIPIHYDLFHGYNDERPGNFVDYLFDRAPYLPIAVLAPGQRLLVSPRR
jgi:L-ascorbate 6-phosphate lactonase